MLIVEKIVDVTTGEETIIEREETAAEKAEREEWQKVKAERLKRDEAASATKAALLEKLGLTEDEAKLLLS